MRICIIALNEKDYAPQRIFQEGKKRGHQMHLTTWNDICLDIQKRKIFFRDGKKEFGQFDIIIPRNCKTIVGSKIGKRTLHRETLMRLLVEFAKQNNIYILNQEYLSDYQGLDKLSQQYFFSQKNLPGIQSCYFRRNKNQFAQKIGFPMVAKIADGSLGKQVLKIKNSRELKNFLEERNKDGEFFLFQKFYQIDSDFRVLVVGREALGTMERLPKKGEWRTNFSLGGSLKKAPKDKLIENLAISVAAKMRLDYVGVDILKYKSRLYIIEVNSFAQFKGFEKTFSEINVAEKIIKLTEKKAQKNKARL